MSLEIRKLRRRVDKFAETEKPRSDLAELGLDDNGIFLLLTEYGFGEQAALFVRRGGLAGIDPACFRRLAEVFRVYFAADKYPGVELDEPDVVEDRKWAAGLKLCTSIVSFVESAEMGRECFLASERGSRRGRRHA